MGSRAGPRGAGVTAARTGVTTAAALGLVGCHECGLVCRHGPAGTRADEACPRCGTRLRLRKRESIARTWALLIAAMILYVPANFVPIMRTVSLFSADDNTILTGVVQLWQAGSWDLAIIVFVASIVVPMLKFFALGLLLISVQRRSVANTQQRTKLFRLVEVVGYWSMLDVFVVALLTGVVQFGVLAQVVPLPGVIWFGLMVVLTMLASMSFDPRLIWDNANHD
jgi:paraquat-inducible protein A